jgi:hypothetical protein
VAGTRHRRDVLFVADTGAIRERLAADGKETDRDAVRQAFLGAARAPRDGQNASDFLADKAAWLRTGDHRAISDAPRMSRVAYVMDRAAKTAIKVRQGVVERARMARVRTRQQGREADMSASRTASRDRGMSMGR